MAEKLCLLFFVIIGVVTSELADFRQCNEYGSSTCEVKEVRITPCRNPKLCRLKKGTVSNIEFDFIPKFSSEKILTSVYWASDIGDQPFGKLDRVDACTYTSCPLQADKQQQFSYNLRLSKLLPNGDYPIKWKVWDENDESKVCCYITNIKLVK